MNLIANTSSVPPNGKGKLLIRPQLLPDEWWEGYVARVLCMNGVRLDTISDSDIESVSHPVGSQQIRGHSVGKAGPFGFRWFGRFLLPSQLLRTSVNTVPICHSCFAKSNHIRMIWRLRYTTTCALHHTVLNDCCPICSRHWRLVDISRGSCSCGFDLQRTDCEKSSDTDHAFSSATDVDATRYYDPHRSAPECVRDDPNLRGLGFKSLWAYILARIDTPFVKSERSTWIQTLLFGSCRDQSNGLSRFSVWYVLSRDTVSFSAICKVLQILNEIKSTAGHNYSLLSALPIASWARELEDHVSSLTVSFDPSLTTAKYRDRSSFLLETALAAVERHFPELLAAGESPLEVLHHQMRTLSFSKLPKSGSFVSLTSREMTLSVLNCGISKLWDGVFGGTIWIYTDHLSPGFSRYYLDRRTYWCWRKDSLTLYKNFTPQTFVRDLYGCAHLLRSEPIRKQHVRLRRTKFRRHVSHPNQILLFQ